MQLVKEMRASFGDDIIITASSHAAMLKAAGQDIKGLFEYIDMYNLMTYDFTTSGIIDSPVTAPNQPLYPPPVTAHIPQNGSVSNTVNEYLAEGIPASKMAVGVAYFGMCIPCICFSIVHELDGRFKNKRK